MWWRSILFLAAMLGLLAALLPNAVWLLTFLLGKLFAFRPSYTPFACTAAVLLLATWVVLAYGYYVGRFKISVRSVEYASADVPTAFDGLRIVHISDLHVDSFEGREEFLRRVVDTVNSQHPDIILFTGDMVTGAIDELLWATDGLKRLSAPGGIYSVLGNHDFFIYTSKSRAACLASASELAAYERDSLGWNVLRNASVVMRRGGDSIAIAGVDNINGNQVFRTIQCGDLQRAVAGLDGVFTILLSHDPSHWEADVLPNSAVQLTLSGHTHSSQFRFLGWSPSSLLFRQTYGSYMHNGRMLYVTAGIGCTVPFRTGCPAEVAVITLRSQK